MFSTPSLTKPQHSVSAHQTIGSVTDQQFKWHQDSNGAVHFVLRGAPLPLMDVTVHLFDYENPQWPEVTVRLRAIPEIGGWLKDHECPIPVRTSFEQASHLVLGVTSQFTPKISPSTKFWTRLRPTREHITGARLRSRDLPAT